MENDCYRKVLDWVFKALDSRDCPESRKPALYYFIGNVYIHGGQGIEKDNKEALKWLLKAGDREDSTRLVGFIYFEGGYGVDKDNKQALE